MEKHIYDEKNGLSYTLHGDYYLPDLVLNEEEPIYGKYGMLRKQFLKEHRLAKYQYLLLTGKLTEHLNQIDQESREQVEMLMEQMAEKQGVTEELKVQNRTKWVRLMNNIKASAEEMVLKLLKSTLFVKLPAIRFHILTSFLVGKLVVLPPFSRGNTAFFKNAEDFLKFLQKFFERTKCARPKSPDGRIGIVSSIQMIRQFIYISVVSPGGGRAFFDKSITVGFCRYAFCFMAATSFSRRFQQ